MAEIRDRGTHSTITAPPNPPCLKPSHPDGKPVIHVQRSPSKERPKKRHKRRRKKKSQALAPENDTSSTGCEQTSSTFADSQSPHPKPETDNVDPDVVKPKPRKARKRKISESDGELNNIAAKLQNNSADRPTSDVDAEVNTRKLRQRPPKTDTLFTPNVRGLDLQAVIRDAETKEAPKNDTISASALREFGLQVVKRDAVTNDARWLGCRFCAVFGCSSHNRNWNYLHVYEYPFPRRFHSHLRKDHREIWDSYRVASDIQKDALFADKPQPPDFLFVTRIAQLKRSRVPHTNLDEVEKCAWKDRLAVLKWWRTRKDEASLGGEATGGEFTPTEGLNHETAVPNVIVDTRAPEVHTGKLMEESENDLVTMACSGEASLESGLRDNDKPEDEANDEFRGEWNEGNIDEGNQEAIKDEYTVRDQQDENARYKREERWALAVRQLPAGFLTLISDEFSDESESGLET